MDREAFYPGVMAAHILTCPGRQQPWLRWPSSLQWGPQCLSPENVLRA